MKKNTLKTTVLITLFLSLIAVPVASAKGKKFGLFVGINKYQGDINPLSGAVNDAVNMRAALMLAFKFKATDTTLLTDAAATRDNILRGLKKYQNLARKGDLFVFHYSGHGTLFPDQYSEYQDETEFVYMEEENWDGEMEVVYPRDKYDSALVPVDADSDSSRKPWDNLILDDEIYEIFSAITRKGAQVVFLSDSCHSGSVGRAARSEDSKRKMTTLRSVFGVKKFSDIKFKKPALNKTSILPPAKGLYVTMSGSKDDEYSLDARVNGVWGGLFTGIMLKNISAKNSNKLTYRKLMDAVTASVATDAKYRENDQHPVLDVTFGNPNALIFSVPK